jgi:hypothetical protein
MAEAGKLVHIKITDGDAHSAEVTVGDQRLTGIEQLSIVVMPDARAAFLRELADQAARNTVHAFDGWAELERKIRIELGEWGDGG